MQRVTPRVVTKPSEELLFVEDSVSSRLRGAVHHARTSTTVVSSTNPQVDLREIYNRKSSNNVTAPGQSELQTQAN